MQPTTEDLKRIFTLKYGDPKTTGWSPQRRYNFGYFTPDDYYEAIVDRLVTPGCRWIDVGGGRNIFPGNQALSRQLADRCGHLVGVDPSETIHENPYVHERVESTIEKFTSDQPFDLATLRMVAEHITQPEEAIKGLARLLKPGGKVVIFTINKWSPVPIVTWITPFWLHHPMKRLLWGTEEKDTFPVAYKMNTRRALSHLFTTNGFRESLFLRLDDCRTFNSINFLNLAELTIWRGLKTVNLPYPENCLCGVYEKI